MQKLKLFIKRETNTQTKKKSLESLMNILISFIRPWYSFSFVFVTEYRMEMSVSALTNVRPKRRQRLLTLKQEDGVEEQLH